MNDVPDTTTPTADRHPLMRQIHRRVIVLMVLTLAVYWPVYRFGLVDYDDPTYLYANPYVHQGISFAGINDAFTRARFANYAPLVSISWELDQSLFALRPGALHVESVLLHLITTLLLWRFLWLATGECNFSFCVAALFLCHPMHVESVAWISERKDVLSTPLLLGAMIAYVRYTQQASLEKQSTRGFLYLLMIFLFTLSLLTKAMGVTLPAVLLLLDIWPLRRWANRNALRLILEKVPLLLISIVFSVAADHAQAGSGATASPGSLSLVDRIDNAIVCYVIYIVKLAVPVDLAVFYPHPGSRPLPAVMASLGLLAIVTLLCWRSRARGPYAIIGWFWFIGTLLPVIGLLQVGAQAMADRYSYLPSIGLFIVVIWAAGGILQNRFVRSTLIASVLVIFTVLAHQQVLYWQDTETLFRHALAVTDENPVAHTELGKVAYRRHDLQQAVDEYTSAGKDAGAYCGLGDCWLTDDPEKAIGFYRRALALRPRSGLFMMKLATALQLNGEVAEAKTLATQAILIDPENQDVTDQFKLYKTVKPKL